MSLWSRESCLAAVAMSAPKSVSLSGSRSSPTQALAAGNHRTLLVATNAGTPPRNSSPSSVLIAGNHRQQAFGSMNPRLNSRSPARRPSASTNGRNGSSSAGGKATLRVDELKRILANGGTTGGFNTSAMVPHHDVANDTASDSMVETESADFGSEDGHYETPPQVPGGSTKADGSTTYESARAASTNADAMPVRAGIVGGGSVGKKSATTRKDLSALLAGISVEKDVGVASAVGMARPPY